MEYVKCGSSTVTAWTPISRTYMSCYAVLITYWHNINTDLQGLCYNNWKYKIPWSHGFSQPKPSKHEGLQCIRKPGKYLFYVANGRSKFVWKNQICTTHNQPTPIGGTNGVVRTGATLCPQVSKGYVYEAKQANAYTTTTSVRVQWEDQVIHCTSRVIHWKSFH